MRIRVIVAAVYVAALSGVLVWGAQQQESRSDPVAMLIETHQHTSAHPPVPEQVEKDSDLILFEDLVANEMFRLGVFEFDYQHVYAEVLRFIEYVKIVESDGNRHAQAKTSSAMSLFQFTIGSVPTAVNRLENYMARQHLGALPEWAVSLRDEPTTLFTVSELRQTILTFVNIVEQRGSDVLLKEFLGGEHEAAKALYYAHHHTDPDAATFRRAERIFSQVFQ